VAVDGLDPHADLARRQPNVEPKRPPPQRHVADDLAVDPHDHATHSA
jgi:hypothetical protein